MATKSIRAIERAVDVLQAIKTLGGSAGVTEVSKELSLAKSTVHRILLALSKTGMVRKDESTNQYVFGYTILELAYTGFQQKDIISLMMPYLEELRDRSGETAALALKIGLKYTYVVQLVSDNEHRVTFMLGRHYPLHWAATGKALLAYVSQSELEECMKIVPFQKSTPNTVSDPKELLTQLEDIRHLGYAVSFSERAIGSSGIASPICARNGYAIAALGIVGPESRIRYIDWHALGEQVAEIAGKAEMVLRASGIDIEIAAPQT